MFKNISKGLKPEQVKDSVFDSDSEEQDPRRHIVIHVGLLGLVAILAGAASVPMSRSSPGATISLNGLLFVLIWVSYAVYAVSSSLGIRRRRSLIDILGVHGAALVLSVPVGIVLMVLLGALMG
ncbi:hypothetical protein [Archangium lansingense]|uniref:Uncharacterized protein n=1 Tax=Archangium lansingense TaxID=2995310 RepID=A0ABT4A4B7_9BACT|nr:hypothetical protein [Archangium lansinium]MCY1076480.1 hypothetical protein [Archangium lansinium]